MTDLKTKAQMCEFANHKDSLIRDWNNLRQNSRNIAVS